MTRALFQVISATVTVSLFLLLNRLTEKKISALGRYLAGLILAVTFLIPLRIPIICIEIPEIRVPYFEEETAIPDDLAPPTSVPIVPLPDDFEAETEAPATSQNPLTTPKAFPLSFEKTLIALYLFGAMATLFCTLFRYCRTAKRLQRCGRAPTEAERSVYLSVCQTLKIKKTPSLLVCPNDVFSSPVTFGVFKQTILVSDAFSADELPMILGHELTHCKRRDSFAKVFFAVLGSAYWFHPLMRLFIRTMNELCESACDERFLLGGSMETKRQYCRLLVLTASQVNKKESFLFTAFKGGKPQMKKRLSNILTEKNKKGAVILVVLMIVIAAISIFVYAATPPVKSKKTDIAPLSPYQLQLTEYTEKILQNHRLHKHDKEDIRIWDFEIAYVEPNFPYLTFNLICESNDTRYTQNIEFNSQKMFISDPQKDTNFSHSDFAGFLTLTDLEKIISVLDVTALMNQKTEISEFFFTYEGYASPFIESPINNKPTAHYILSEEGFASPNHDKENSPIPMFLLQINDDFYRIFIDIDTTGIHIPKSTPRP